MGYGPGMSASSSGQPGHTAQDDPTLGALVHDLTQQVPQLIRSELRLAQAEMTQKGKRAGLGIGMFSAAGLLALFGLASVVATAILALAHAVPDWLAALIVAAALFVLAGVAAMVGRKEVQQATPPTPEQAIEGVREDISVIKGEHR
jgi:uncharacterized membrane protein YqjE